MKQKHYIADAVLYAPTLRDAKEMAKRGNYDKLLETAVSCPDEIKQIKLEARK